MGRALILALLSLCTLAACQRSEDAEQVPSESTGLEREIRGFSLTETVEGTRLWELHADYAYRLPRNSRIRLERIELLFFDEEGEVDSRLTSYKGFVDEDTGEMTALEDVVLVSTRGDTLTTEELTYVKDQDLIRGPDYVRLAKPDRVLTGFGFQSKPDLSDYKVERDVRITIHDGSENAPDR
jgi:LPS export ABC transporter protein LptC